MYNNNITKIILGKRFLENDYYIIPQWSIQQASSLHIYYMQPTVKHRITIILHIQPTVKHRNYTYN